MPLPAPGEAAHPLIPAALLAAGCVVALTACANTSQAARPESQPGDGQRLRVVATTNIVGDVVAQVGGDAIELAVLIPLGQDPHTYEPTPTDIARIEAAQVIFVNGFDLEENLLTFIEPMEGDVAVAPVSAGIQPRESEGIDDDHEHEEADPHTWMDPNNVVVWVENITSQLTRLDPGNAETYRANAAAYVEALEELDASIQDRLASIPASQRKLVTNHEALGYFADRYDFEVIGTVFNGTSQLAEPSAGEIAALVEIIEREDAQAIFIETTVSDALAGVVADEVGHEVAVLSLYTGSLGEPGSGADSYLGMMRLNADIIAAALGPG